MRLFVISSLLSLSFASGTYMSLDEAKEFATLYYSTIKKTLTTGKLPSTKDLIETVGRDSKGVPLYTDVKDFPNYIILLDKSLASEQRTTPETIFGEITDFKQEHRNATFDYKCRKFNYCSPPELVKNEEKPSFAWFIFSTEWFVDGKRTVIDDTVYVNLEYKYISRICNKIAPLNSSAEETLEEMLAKALGLYNNKKYDEAASLYQKILRKHPENGDTWYYLGVMYFKGQGVGKLSKTQRLKKAYDCWKKSDSSKAHRAISYITDGRE